MPLISQVAILLIIGAVVSANHANIFTTATALVIPVVMLHNLCGYGLGFVFSKLLHLKETQQKAITFEVGMQDSSLGATLAMKYFVPQAAIPSTIFQFGIIFLDRFYLHGGRIILRSIRKMLESTLFCDIIRGAKRLFL